MPQANTEKSYNTAREIYCTARQTALSDRTAATLAYKRSLVVYDKRKHLFEWTEKNYRLYRNLDICLDAELTTGNASLTTNVATYNSLSTTLYTGLTGITATAKKLKTLVNTLRDRASDLENFKNDQCNAGQWGLLTGENVENCHPERKPGSHERPDVCKDAANIYCELISITRKSLVFDVDSLIQSSADVTGIQTFSNIGLLTTLQAQLSTASTNFVQQVQKAKTTRAADLTTAENNLAAATQDCTKAGVDNFNKISVAYGCHVTLEFLCNPPCGCARPLDTREPAPRLEECECRICKIGESIRSTDLSADSGGTAAGGASGGTGTASGGAASDGATSGGTVSGGSTSGGASGGGASGGATGTSGASGTSGTTGTTTTGGAAGTGGTGKSSGTPPKTAK